MGIEEEQVQAKGIEKYIQQNNNIKLFKPWERDGHQVTGGF
jgi:hypothetical protein